MFTGVYYAQLQRVRVRPLVMTHTLLSWQKARFSNTSSDSVGPCEVNLTIHTNYNDVIFSPIDNTYYVGATLDILVPSTFGEMPA